MEAQKRRAIIKFIIWLIVLLIVLAGVTAYWQYRTYYPSTDDAYVQAHVTYVAPQVTGPIKHIYVKNNQLVVKSQKLFDIDSALFRIAVAAARAHLDLAEQNMRMLQDAVKSAQALVAQRRSELDVTLKNSNRILALEKVGQVSKSAGDEARSKIKVAKAALSAVLSQLDQAKENLGDIGQKNAQIRAAAANLNQAKLNLKHTHIVAPSAGKIVNFTVRSGSMVQAGVPLFQLVDQGKFWLSANFKETQLQRIKVGQKATLTVDMYPKHEFKGVVESISAGSGTAFSLLPAENATGNWVKVTQRIPVKIVILNPSKKFPLRVGSSATVIVNTVQKAEVRGQKGDFVDSV